MTARAGEPFDARRAVSETEALLAEPLPASGPTIADGAPGTGEWTRTRGEGFLIVPLWESEGLTGVYGEEWTEAEETALARLASLIRELDRRWGPHRRVGMRVPLFRKTSGEPMPPLFQALCDEDCYGDLTVWGPLPSAAGEAPRWAAVSLNQSDGDAPMVITAVVSDRPITELDD